MSFRRMDISHARRDVSHTYRTPTYPLYFLAVGSVIIVDLRNVNVGHVRLAEFGHNCEEPGGMR